MKTALITGYSGQDGTFLARLLLDKGYQVVGLVRRISTEPPYRVRGRFDFTDCRTSGQLVLESGDLNSTHSLIRIFKKYKVDEVYNLAAQSDVRLSFDQPELTSEINYFGVMNLITVMRHFAPAAKLYQASTSELFGQNSDAPQDEETPFKPASPYAVAKLAAHWLVINYRKEDHFAAAGILFNHESELRGGNFVTQKIARFVGRWLHNHDEVLELGNLDGKRDWGYAGDFVRAMWLILQQETPEDFVIGTGETHTVREFVEAAFAVVDQKVEWRGTGVEEVGLVNGRVAVKINPEFYRPVEVNLLQANAGKARTKLGWKPEVTFDQLVRLMVEASK